MSITLLTAAWDLEIDSTEKMVLMCLCTHADDAGLCWPSVGTIARKCSKSERTVQSALRWLSEHKFFTFTDRPGRGRLYQLNPRKICTPAKSAPVQKTTSTPADFAPHPRKSCTQIVNEPSRRVEGNSAGENLNEADQASLADSKPKRVKQEKVAMSEDWQPAELPANVKALTDQWPPGRLQREVDQFRDYWIDRGDSRPGWDRTFHNRIRDIHDRVMRDNRNGNGTRNHQQDDEPRNPYVRAAIERQAERAALGQGHADSWSEDGF